MLNRMLRRGAALLLAVILVVGMIPPAAAADDEDVLTGLEHMQLGDAVSAGTMAFEFTVPYSYVGTSVDFSNALIPSFDTTIYEAASIALSFQGSSIATIDDAAVTLTVGYKMATGGDDTLYTSNYSISVKRGDPTPPTFSGTINKSLTAPGQLAFTAADFNACYTANDAGGISGLSITGGSAALGELYLDGVLYTGTHIPFADITKLTFKAGTIAADSGVATYQVEARYLNTVNTPVLAGTATLKITVTRNIPTVSLGSVESNKTLGLGTAASQMNTACNTATGDNLNYVTFTLPPSSTGILYVNYGVSGQRALKNTDKVYRTGTSPLISDITFVPNASYSGTVSLTYEGYPNTGASFTGKLTFSVTKADLTKIVYNIDSDTARTLNNADFNTACTDATGKALDFIRFTSVSTSYGNLYYNYNSSTGAHGDTVDTGTHYYYASNKTPRISLITFVPDTTTSRTVTFNYTGYAVDGTDFAGTVTFNITKTANSTVRYETDNQTPVSLSANPFIDACDEAFDGSTLSYIRFTGTLPTSSGGGVLYYNYSSSSGSGTAVKTNTSYYRTSSLGSTVIGNLTFVPRSNYTGTVTINYEGYTTTGSKFTGKILITVTAVDDTVIKYTTESGAPVTFETDDFNAVCRDLNNNRNLDYVRFTLPNSSQGKLYLNYKTSTGTGTSVSSSTKYYRNSSPHLSDISFVPADNFTGTVTIKYTGYDSAGNDYEGKIVITVREYEAKPIIYYAEQGEVVNFLSSDFQTYCKDQMDENLSYVTFTLPGVSYGTLYQGYSTSSSPGTKVTSSTKYYRNTSPTISTVSFVPYSGTWTGSVNIQYKAYTTSGESYTDEVRVVIYKANAGEISLTSNNQEPVTFDAATFNTACKERTGGTLNYVTFSLPSSSQGTLYYNYKNASSYESQVSSGQKYYYSGTPALRNVTFVPASNYTGTVTINYTAYDTDGNSFTGTIKILTVGIQASSRYFTDVGSNYSWAAPYIDALYERGVVTGIGDNKYNPGGNITRGDFMLMLYRAFDLRATGSSVSQFADVSSGDYYYDAILTARRLGIALGDGKNYYPKSSITREEAMVLTLRTLEEVGISLTAGTSSNLASFSDRGQISDYAVTAVATLVRAGLIEGDAGRISPKSNMNRASMATFLYRVLAL